MNCKHCDSYERLEAIRKLFLSGDLCPFETEYDITKLKQMIAILYGDTANLRQAVGLYGSKYPSLQLD